MTLRFQSGLCKFVFIPKEKCQGPVHDVELGLELSREEINWEKGRLR